MSTEPFVKLLSSITDSSVWAYDDQTRIVWITMLAMANRRGVVHAAVPGIANRARVSLESAEKAVAIFEAPDPYSRNPDNDGRRVVRVEGGFRLLNYEKVRNLKDIEADRVRKRKWWREHRGKKELLDTELDALDITRQTSSASVCTSVEAKQATKKYGEQSKVDGFSSWWEVWPNRKAKEDAEKAWSSLSDEERSTMVDLTKDYLARRMASESAGVFVPNIPLPATYLRKKRWTDQFDTTPQGRNKAKMPPRKNSTDLRGYDDKIEEA